MIIPENFPRSWNNCRSNRHTWGVTQQLSERRSKLFASQHGVISRQQAVIAGLDPATIDGWLRSGRWQQLHRGVYATFTGGASREALLWAAVLRTGHEAALSYQSAAELDKLLDGPSDPIHVTIPGQRRVGKIPGVVVHRSDWIRRARHPSLSPPRTMIEETVLDLTQAADEFDDAFSWVSRACQRELTLPTLLRMRMDLRKKMRWRTELSEALGDVGAGVHSALEFRYVRDVERAHHLPGAKRQARVTRQGARQYRDVLYEAYGVCVELDGQVAHPAETRWRDIRRDNANAADGIITLRYGWADVRPHACEVAAEVAAVLRLRGWTGKTGPCGPGCPVS